MADEAMLRVKAGMKARDSIRMATPSAAMAAAPNELTNVVITALPNETSDCWIIEGKPMRKMRRIEPPSHLSVRGEIAAMWSLRFK